MKIQINEKNEILSYAKIGDLNNSVEFDGTIPEDFWRNFKPYFYMLKNDEIVENPDYVAPSSNVPTGPSDVQNIVMQQARTIIQMQSVLMQQSKDIAELKGANV
ncbi:DUF2977 domain-containing protein [Pediococcus pentosaceus]|uniref:DUF2977 domain-containing protein n=1 Tax=Pediococcus pentosaceus TaxID=1255 RepID=UPI000C080DD9|nr:DUF2977 domain-containing protein [Pediococcus pentosaceus]